MTDLITEMRNNVQLYMKSNQYESAIFWAELLLNKVVDCSPTDLYIYLKALYHNGQFRRVINMIDKYQLAKRYLTFRLLGARCYFAIKDCISAIQILDIQRSSVNMCYNNGNLTKNLNPNLSATVDVNSGFSIYDSQETAFFGQSLKELENNCYLLLGEIYDHMENRDTAIEYYKLAVKSDVRCYAAIQKLYSGNMMTSYESRAFLESLDYRNCGDDRIGQIIRASYEDLFNIECETGQESNCPKIEKTLWTNHSASLLNIAMRYYNNSKFKKAYKLTKRILEDDPHNPHSITLHAAILTELKQINELFSFANSLIENYPDKKESWYAIGCYYLATDRFSLARQQFLKATEIDKFFGFAWLAIGHTYSMDNERDQALSAYCSASQAIKSCHLPILYIALEYSLSNNTSVSVNYLQEAMKIGSHDPYCWHEKGFIAFNNKNYQESLKFCLNAYEFHRNEHSSITGFWEPLLNNIAHCFYKLGDYDKSLEFFEKALGKRPKNPSTMSSIALVYTRKGDTSKAMNYLNRVLGLDRDNNFARSLMMTLTNQNCKYFNKLIVDLNMSTFTPSKDHLREVLIHYFMMKKTAAESYKILQEESSNVKDPFKVPMLIDREFSSDNYKLEKHFESLRQILIIDESKIEEKEMDLF